MNKKSHESIRLHNLWFIWMHGNETFISKDDNRVDLIVRII